MTLVEFLRVVRSGWIVLVITTLVGAALGYGYAMTQPRVYTSTATGFVVVGNSVDSGMSSIVAGSTIAQERAQAYLPILGSRAVAQEVAALSQTGITEGEVNVSGSVAEGSVLFIVSATSTVPEKAQEMANLALQATANVVKSIENNDNIRVVPLEDAELPGAPSSPNYRNLVFVGAVAGLVLGIIFVFLRRAVDVKVRTTKDLETLTGAGLLGIVPKTDDLKNERRGTVSAESPAAEAIRQLRTNLRFVSIDKPPRSIMVTSPNPKEGKSTISSSLARSLARSGQATLIIDADLRRPMQATVFGIDGSVGLSQLLTGQATLDTALHRIGEAQLYVLPAGRIPPNPSELLGSMRMRKLIREAANHFTVIIDAPPMLPVTDASLLSTEVDGTILVTSHGKTDREHVEVAVKMLDQVGGRLLGSVLNNVKSGGAGTGYYGIGYGRNRRGYEAYYRSGEGPDVEVELPPARPSSAVSGGASGAAPGAAGAGLAVESATAVGSSATVAGEPGSVPIEAPAPSPFAAPGGGAGAFDEPAAPAVAAGSVTASAESAGAAGTRGRAASPLRRGGSASKS